MSERTEIGRTVAGVELPEPGTWAFDPAHSSITAVARHLMVTKVRGTFERFSGTIHVAERPEDSWVEVEIDAASIDTRVPERDAHLRSPDFLDVERYPRITFRSTGLEPLEGTRFRLPGELTIRGVTRPVVLEAEYLGAVTDPWGNRKVGFTATGEIDREDFGITWNQVLETGGVLVGPKLKVEIEVQAARAEQRAA
ncbi:MAG TPA: YceI family protein [Actinomycetota bacterium]|nr:YceI family protein [Actinomycetota bacterium]